MKKNFFFLSLGEFTDSFLRFLFCFFFLRYSSLNLFSFFIKLKINQKVKDWNSREYLSSDRGRAARDKADTLRIGEKRVKFKAQTIPAFELSRTRFPASFPKATQRINKATTNMRAFSTWIERKSIKIEEVKKDINHTSSASQSRVTRLGKKEKAESRIWSVNSLFQPSVKQLDWSKRRRTEKIL